MEPRLVVFTSDEKIVQMFVCAEQQDLFKVPSTSTIEIIVCLMACYFVYNVAYPTKCRASLCFYQYIQMEKFNNCTRPIRYGSFIASINNR